MKGIGSDLGAREIIDLCKVRHINSKSSIWENLRLLMLAPSESDESLLKNKLEVRI